MEISAIEIKVMGSVENNPVRLKTIIKDGQVSHLQYLECDNTYDNSDVINNYIAELQSVFSLDITQENKKRDSGEVLSTNSSSHSVVTF